MLLRPGDQDRPPSCCPASTLIPSRVNRAGLLKTDQMGGEGKLGSSYDSAITPPAHPELIN